MSFFQEHKWSILIGVIAVLVIAIVAVLLFRKPSASAPSQSSISVTVQAPAQAGSGTQVVYQIQVANNSSNGIRSIKLDPIYPQGFTFQDANPTPSQISGGEFSIPDLSAGQNAVIMIKGTLVGNSGETKELDAILHYQFDNFNSQFTSKGIGRTQITNSSIGLSIDGPTSTNPAQNVSYSITYDNTTSQAMNNLVLLVTLPNGFVVSSSSPTLDATSRLSIPTLAGNQSGTLTINGTFANAAEGAQETLAAEIDGPDATTGQSLSVASATYPIIIVQAPLQLTATIQDNSQGGTPTANVVQPGDVLIYSIHYQNNGSVAATGVTITAKIDGAAVSLGTVQADKARIQNNLVTWDASQTPSFASLPPQASGDLKLQFQISNPATRDSSSNLGAQVTFGISSHESQQQYQVQTAQQKIQTQVGLSGTAALSSGANPPTVGKTSTYLMTFTLRNASNTVQNGAVSIALPNAMGFDMTSVNTDQVKNVTYNTTTHVLTWTVPTIPAHAGQFSAAPKLQFAETIQPSVTDRGNTIVLANSITFTGTDTFTAIPVTASLQNLTTNDSGTGSVQ